jgi:branched-chain amino acid aminotransferase/4-amino-4-deoxychorismate lyase
LAGARTAGLAVEEGLFGPDALATAEAIVLTNSLIGARPAAALDGRPLDSAALAERLNGWIEV